MAQWADSSFADDAMKEVDELLVTHWKTKMEIILVWFGLAKTTP